MPASSDACRGCGHHLPMDGARTSGRLCLLPRCFSPPCSPVTSLAAPRTATTATPGIGPSQDTKSPLTSCIWGAPPQTTWGTGWEGDKRFRKPVENIFSGGRPLLSYTGETHHNQDGFTAAGHRSAASLGEEGLETQEESLVLCPGLQHCACSLLPAAASY